MRISFLKLILVTELLALASPAPKLGHVLFDPLTYNVVNFLTRAKAAKWNIPRRFLRTADTDQTQYKPCLGYDYDDTLCKVLNGRILCGYNKNFGEMKDLENTIDIGNRCRIRGDRIECGYLEGPFLDAINSHTNQQENGVLDKMAYHLTTRTTNKNSQSTINRHNTKRSITTSAFSVNTIYVTLSNTKSTIVKTTATTMTTTTTTTTKPTLTTTEQNSNSEKSKFKCVEKEDRLFCYELKSK